VVHSASTGNTWRSNDYNYTTPVPPPPGPFAVSNVTLNHNTGNIHLITQDTQVVILLGKVQQFTPMMKAGDTITNLRHVRVAPRGQAVVRGFLLAAKERFLAPVLSMYKYMGIIQ
jgi:hypothetical protein